MPLLNRRDEPTALRYESLLQEAHAATIRESEMHNKKPLRGEGFQN